jgi:hypothetical protein
MTCDVHFKAEGTFVLSWTIDRKNPICRVFREPIFRLGPAPTAAALGHAVRQALDTSGTPAPEGCGKRLDAALREVGLKGWSGLMSSSRLLTVEDNGSRVKVRAWRHRDSDPDPGEMTCDCAPEELGRSLLALGASCSISDPLSPARPGRSYRRPKKTPIADGGTPQTFGYKTYWIVVDTNDAGAVASALGLSDLRPVTWDIDPYYLEGVFVSPPVLGWTYVLGLYVEPHFPQFVPLLEDLSRRFGEVQYFTSHRVVDLQAWVRAIDGRIARGYCWIGERGEIIMDVGDITPEESELGFSRFINARTVDGDWDKVEFPHEEDVMRIASRWSINPQELDAYDSEGTGVMGRLP